MIDFKDYIKDLQSEQIDNITEHSKRSALEILLKQFAGQCQNADHTIKILHEPKRKDNYGSPDFKVYTDSSIIGYVENKKITEILDKTLKTDQIKKYRELSQNILLTNYIEFVWIKGDTIQRETLCYQSDLENKKFKPDTEKCAKVEKLISFFFSQAPQQIANPKELALALAIRSKNLKDFLLDELLHQQAVHTEGRLFGLYETFKQNVFHELELTEFADAFAQMLTYGLFLAKLNADTKTISLANAKEYIPKSFQLIRELVSFLDELNNEEYKETKWIIDETISIMNNIELAELKRQLSFTKRPSPSPIGAEGEAFETDPYIYFYETFLTAYDSKLRKAKGVYYTPPQVVNFITRAINDILKNVFKIPAGFADRNKVTVLDFATGTGTFLLEMIKQTLETIPPDSKAKRDLIIREHILKNFYGFEYLIAPYTIAHLKLSQYLHENGYTFGNNERLQIFLTNTLEPINAQLNFLLPQLSKEGEQAQKVKEKPILVITGNPPYSGHSKNNGEWISNKIKDYYFIDGKPLGEKNPKWLQDDYVKFIRFAQDKMEHVEQGVIGIITNHSFLDNPTFRGMRQSLMNSFDQMYFIDLHGNAKKKEKTPDGGKDENVFDIEQGVAISILVKKKGLEKKVFHADFWGEREVKYEQCLSLNLNTIAFNQLNIDDKYRLFIPRNNDLSVIYNKNWAINDIFKITSVGIATSKDAFVIDYSKNELMKRIDDFLNKNNSVDALKLKYNLKEGAKFSIQKSKNKLEKLNKENLDNICCLYHYRPFDVRYLFYEDSMLERARKEVMVNLQDDNIALITNRQVKTDNYYHSFVTKQLNDLHIIETANANPYTFPLYILKNGIERTFFGVSELESYYKAENFTKDFRTFINAKYNKTYTPEQILGYIYAILHSPTYRSKYAEFLKIDFPRIPFTDSAGEFEKLSQLGYTLVQMHLLNQLPQGGNYLGMGAYKGEDDNVVNKPFFSAYPPPHNQGGIGRLFINARQYFDNVPESVYNFHIGGYQVLDKYLKDRKTRTLTIDEIENVENVVKVLAFTIKQMELIDNETKGWI
jgi:hypothetical protein